MSKRKGDGVNTCKACGSEELFDAHFNKEGYAVTGGEAEGGKYRTVCQACGQFQDKPVKRGKKSTEQGS